MKRIKILLADPRHSTVGVHSSYIPVALGYIGTYLLKELKNININIKLSTEAKETFDLLESWKPDIIGASNYIWNSTLSNTICEHAKKISPNTLCVLGGAEFPAGTGARKIENTTQDKTYDKTLKYLIDRPCVDYYTFSDGEVAFLEIVKNYVKNNFSLKSLKIKDKPINGCASVSKDKKKLLVGNYIPRIGMEGSIKAQGRDIIPSPYLSGFLDKYLDGAFVPAFETARGCPFLCTFCDQGLDQSKMATFGNKRLHEELMYVGKKLHKLKKGTGLIAFLDANWGMYQKDVEFADSFREVIEKYDWPKSIYITTPKSHMENILIIDDKLKNRVEFSLSMQSLDDKTLANIKRKNWTQEKYIYFIKEIEKRGKTPRTDMIIPLPGETEETYLKSTKFLMDHKCKPLMMTLMMLCGAELGRDEAIKKYGMVSKYRILPGQFGEYHGKKIFEIERICAATNTMSHKEYLNCRNYNFVQELLTNQAFAPIYKLTQKAGISWYELTRKVFEVISDKNFKGELKDLFNQFCQESHNELFNSEQEAIDFYSEAKNYKSLEQGDIGDNLLGKYTAKSLLVFDDILTTVYYVIRNKLISNYDKKKELDSVLNSSEKWLKSLYMIKEIFGDKKNVEKNNKHKLNMDFDFPAWLSKNHLPFANFEKNTIYELNLDFEKIDYIRNEINSVHRTSKQRRFLMYLNNHGNKGVGLWEKRIQKIS